MGCTGKDDSSRLNKLGVGLEVKEKQASSRSIVHYGRRVNDKK